MKAPNVSCRHVGVVGSMAICSRDCVILLIKIRKEEKKAHLKASLQVVVLVVLPIRILIRSTLLLLLCGTIEVATLLIRRREVVGVVVAGRVDASRARSTLLLSLCGTIEVATLPIRCREVVVVAGRVTRLEPVVKIPFLNL